MNESEPAAGKALPPLDRRSGGSMSNPGLLPDGDGYVAAEVARMAELLELIAGLVWVAERNGLSNDPYVVRAKETIA